VAAATHHSGSAVLGVILTLLAVNQVFDQIVTPRVVGGLVGLHPVASLFALTAGAELFGLPGMIFAVPVAASLQVVLITLWPQLAAPLPEAPTTSGESGSLDGGKPPPMPHDLTEAGPDALISKEAGFGTKWRRRKRKP
jgi:hypothetical protein